MACVRKIFRVKLKALGCPERQNTSCGRKLGCVCRKNTCKQKLGCWVWGKNDINIFCTIVALKIACKSAMVVRKYCDSSTFYKDKG